MPKRLSDIFSTLLSGHKKTDQTTVRIKRTRVEKPKDIPTKELPVITTPHLITGIGHSEGLQRDHNEDTLFTLTTCISGENGSQPFGIFIVADGMGGHQYGSKASGIAARVMAEHLLEHIYKPLLCYPPKQPKDALQDIMRTGLLEAHQSVIKLAPGGGTTLTAAVVIGQQMTLAHAGDSRAYAIHHNQHMEVLTRDHSLVKRLVELNQITQEEAISHPKRHVLYRALGQGEPLEPEIITSTYPNNGYLLICSDGLWSVVDEDQIYKIITQAPNLPVACQQLIEAANTAGGPDNIAIILVQSVGQNGS
ncbi:MAG: protein phosphatase 2C domain-containing protein [Chloroflexota bacterium]